MSSVELGSSAAECATLVNRDEVIQVIKVPEFVASEWLKQEGGTMLGVISGPKLVFPASLGLPVKDLRSKEVSTSGKHWILNSPGKSVIRGSFIEGVGRGNQRVYLPDVMDAGYRQWLTLRDSKVNVGKKSAEVAKTPKVLSLEEAAALQQKLLDDRTTSVDGGANRLFHYFTGEGGVSSEQSTAPNSPNWAPASSHDGSDFNKKRRRVGGQLTLEDAQARLFKFFEEKNGEGANMREIVQYLGGGMSQSAVKQILDTVAEARRERQGKRVLFVLKPEFMGGAQTTNYASGH